MMRRRIKEVIQYRSMLWSFVLSELRTRYKGSVLGFLWTFANPLLMLFIYTLVFSTVMKIAIPHYATFLFIGLLAWNMFGTGVQSATSVIVRQGSLVKKIYFPREVLPLSVVLGSLINYLLSLLILVPLLLFNGFSVNLNWFYFPLVTLIELILTTGFALLFSSIQVFLRDTEHMLGIVLMLCFYITPAFYKLSMVPKNYQQFYRLNPISDIIIFVQDIFYYQVPPDWTLVLYCFCVSFIALILGWMLFNRLSHRFAEEV